MYIKITIQYTQKLIYNSLDRRAQKKKQFLSKFIKLKDPCTKRKPAYDTSKTKVIYLFLKKFILPDFFQENIKDLKNMWKGIKKMISSNNSNHIFPLLSQLIIKQSLTHLTLLMPSITILRKLL